MCQKLVLQCATCFAWNICFNLYYNPMRNVLFLYEKLCLERVMDLPKFKQLVNEGVTTEVGQLRHRI